MLKYILKRLLLLIPILLGVILLIMFIMSLTPGDPATLLLGVNATPEAVEALNVGDTIDVEGFLYWYEGVNPHITSVVKAAA